jgi:hypothetical protein
MRRSGLSDVSRPLRIMTIIHFEDNCKSGRGLLKVLVGVEALMQEC